MLNASLDERIKLFKGDITKLTVDIIVNAANSSLLGGSGVDGAIHKVGGKQILEECMKIRNKQGGCKVGDAVITSAGNLKAKYVIHTVGPVWNGGKGEETNLLERCYTNTLKLAQQCQAKSIAFPCISTGIYRFPKNIAAEIAYKRVKEFFLQDKHLEMIIFACFDEENFNQYKSFGLTYIK
ncbi:O-acetyl-ADP-ribose deacetylase [Clostridium beijerinckii]|uniref:O-acetyl-ADP-ribose deacetylase n=1 Tax=Clostridium beijerinckii TaxID=1520 RepID=UPI001494E1C6|nr:O-acetyl-ADP-ribose deacetylase [Clostridium beijerinckii]NOW06148.1 O-acetyl-ADP-ribose deacetylase (regulator of RNase III) [Clostridium beijerinckii]NYC00708.1 O-acetyl-ADP-ribose deacetylase (regulator of RNase III) [Clostridium beijerinckii]